MTTGTDGEIATTGAATSSKAGSAVSGGAFKSDDEDDVGGRSRRLDWLWPRMTARGMPGMGASKGAAGGVLCRCVRDPMVMAKDMAAPIE